MKKHLFYHIAFWLCVYLLWVFVLRNYSFSFTKTMTVEFCYLLFITADYYLITALAIPLFLQKRKYAWFVVTAVGVIAFSAWLRALVALEMNLHFFHPGQIIDFGKLYIRSLANIFIWVQVIVAGKLIIDRVRSQQHVALLEKEKINNEMNFLKAQINPHALFNSLNAIYGHIDKNNQTARNILLKFSGLLRYQLYECAEDKIAIEKEMDYIRNYIAFQQLRKENNLVVCLEMDDLEPGLKIAPLLLVVLIENAFKFVSNFPGKENRIVIRLASKNGMLHTCIGNSTEQRATQASPVAGGIGIVNLKRRLALLYADKHEMTISRGDNYYQTNLNIDLT